jgi:hypothetical protein
MKALTNLFRFIIFVPLSLGFLYLIYLGIWQAGLFLIKISTFWLIAIFLFGNTIILSFSMMIFAFVGQLLSQLNPYKKVGNWIIIPLAVILALINIYAVWDILDLTFTRQVIVALILSILIAYLTLIFSATISGVENQ